MLVDSHCHLDRLKVSAAEAVADARSRGVEKIMCIGVDMPNMSKVLDITREHDEVVAAVGIHPLSVDETFDIAEVARLSDNPKVVAIGETGLDYHYETSELALQRQRDAFVSHLQLAKQVKKPVVIHTRAAQQDTLQLIAAHGDLNVGGVLHCFTESWDMAKAALDLGYYISISGIVTFANADNVREVAKQVPADRLLIETDAPWLTPVPNRGKPNLPGYVRDVAHYMADLRGVDYQTLVQTTGDNFFRMIGSQK